MKRIVIVLAMLALVFGTAFAQMAIRAEIGTNIVDLNFDEIGDSEYFTTNDYEDTKIEFNLNADMWGAQVILDFNAEDGKANIDFNDVSAWAKFSTFSKIKIGMFNDRIDGNRNHDVIDEYKLGILQFDPTEGKFLKELVEGDRLNNFVVDGYVGPVTLQFMMHPFMTAGNAGDKDHRHLQIGGRVRVPIGDILNITVNAIHDGKSEFTDYQNTGIIIDDDGTFSGGTEYWAQRTTIGAFFEFPNLAGIGLDLVAGYTVSIWNALHGRNSTGAIIDRYRYYGDKYEGIDHGIDLRAEVPMGDFVFATHNNLSIYGASYDEGSGASKVEQKKSIALYNEIEVEYGLTDDMEVHLALRSQYWAAGKQTNINSAGENEVYDFGILLGFQYDIFEKSTIEVGLNVKHIGGWAKNQPVKLSIPFRYTFWY